MDERAAAGPVVVAANWYRFRPGEQIHHLWVHSVCCLWVLSGSGVVESTGQRFHLTAGDVLRLPWGHDVAYRADGRSPFRLGTVHVVPRHACGRPVVPEVAHAPGGQVLDDSARSDDPDGADLPILWPGRSGVARRLGSLGRYVVERFADGPFDESVFRALGAVVLAETRAARDGEHETVPVALDRMTDHVLRNLQRPMSVAEIAAAGDCSESTAGRLFAAHLGSSVSTWVRETRMRHAAELLVTSGLRVGEVAAAVGFADQLYFSRVFRAAFGVPPSRYGSDRIRP
ncbi:AraC family transcriptional regulator [Curtobacterium sp. PhB115]|uniref:AraC family transcriptional regulator n=1 Tax=Curtobacterium sp. PhB115 TaxID=2485173 RepID=UPI000F4C4D6C|nr:AraC family transcriptional regulator [Curtobacterium sp. PhB115]ROP65391.1 AraC-like DNA-binding protein [Curtobacterium sp. PhB115]